MKYRYVVVGAGITGLTVAERVANVLEEKVLVVEKRKHIGGNCYDEYNEDGLLIHKYGPHIFHTQRKDVFDYLSQFTKWNRYQHRVLTYVDGNLLPMPICARTINMLYHMNLSTEEVKGFLESVADSGREIQNSEDVVLSQAGQVIYEKFFKHYTKKQWDVYPSELDPSVISRVPIRTSTDERYFTDRYQGMPAAGYTKMFERMAQSENIDLMLGVDYRDVIGDIDYDLCVYTGPVDEYFNYEHGRLKYRSIDVLFETKDMSEYQSAAVVNYPNDYDFTRITEYKKLTGQQSGRTVLSFEYPTWDGEPYYPVPSAAQKALYSKYAAMAKAEEKTLFAGRLAEYRYYNMDAAAAAALDLFDRRIR